MQTQLEQSIRQHATQTTKQRRKESVLTGNETRQRCCSQRRCQLSQEQSQHGNISVEPDVPGGLE
jgi:hypothetical protein